MHSESVHHNWRADPTPLRQRKPECSQKERNAFLNPVSVKNVKKHFRCPLLKKKLCYFEMLFFHFYM